MSPPTLVLLHHSPWSERVRWAFEHHAIEYKKVHHVPVVGELKLRKLAGRRDGPATVPLLIDEGRVIGESWDIARWADRHGRGAPLIPAARADEVRRFNDLADAAMRGGRALIVNSLLASDAALDEAMPPGTPTWLRALFRPVNRAGMRWFGKKYGVDVADIARYEARLREGLDALRAALEASSPHVLGEFSYADIALATLLQGVMPVADAYLRLGPATRAAWTQPHLAREYVDLVAWRDALYQRHRARRT